MDTVDEILGDGQVASSANVDDDPALAVADLLETPLKVEKTLTDMNSKEQALYPHLLVAAAVPFIANDRPVVLAREVHHVARLGVDESVFSTRAKSSHSYL